MTVIRLPDGGLFLHSPVRLDDRLRSELDALGTVRAVVAPNKAHHLYVGDYRVPYPKARFYGALGLQTKRRDLAFFGMLGDEPMPEWRGAIEQRFFRGAPWLNEVVFFHPASRTLVLTDLAFNVPTGKVWGIPFVFKLMGAEGVFGPHRFIRWSIGTATQLCDLSGRSSSGTSTVSSSPTATSSRPGGKAKMKTGVHVHSRPFMKSAYAILSARQRSCEDANERVSSCVCASLAMGRYRWC